MSAEEKPLAMPDQPKTAQLPAVSPVEVMLKQMEIAITASMQAGFRETNANIDLVTGDVKSLKADVRTLQEWKLHVEREPPLTSDRVRDVVNEQPSRSDMEALAQLAQERAAREALAADVVDLKKGHEQLNEKTDAQTAILVAISENAAKFVASPRVKIAGGILFGIVAKWLADHYGIHLPQ